MATSTRKPKPKTPSSSKKAQSASTAERDNNSLEQDARPPRTANAIAASNNGTPPAHEQIERRAYEIFVARGASHGMDKEDWFRAEREILGMADGAS